VVLVGHSYGGAVITEAGAHPHVAHLQYIAAFQLAEGESVGRTLPDLQIPPTRLGDGLRFSGDDRVDLNAALAAELFYADAPPPVVTAAIATAPRAQTGVRRGAAEDRLAAPALDLRRLCRGSGSAPGPAASNGPPSQVPPRVADRTQPALSCPDKVAALIMDLVASLDADG
jgi:hypothetical protein